MPEEIREIEAAVQVKEKKIIGGREFHIGSLGAQDVVLVLARIGKVAAATTATTLINHFNVDAILLTGVAGGVHPAVKIGDIVVGSSFIQHDMDASASQRFKKYEIPLLGLTEIAADEALIAKATNAVNELVKNQTTKPTVHVGLMGAGDQFIASKEKIMELRRELPALLCVEMEGAAAAQVCYEYGKPFVSIRSISDNADDDAGVDFLKFVEENAAPVSKAVVVAMLGK